LKDPDNGTVSRPTPQPKSRQVSLLNEALASFKERRRLST
jgi:hypothetical protein